MHGRNSGSAAGPHLPLPAPRPADPAPRGSQPAACPPGSAPVTAASLQADLAAAQDRSARPTTRIRQLERKLAELLGHQACKESGLGAPHDIEQLQRLITELEQSVVDPTRQLSDRDDELAAATVANREMIAQINRTRTVCDPPRQGRQGAPTGEPELQAVHGQGPATAPR